MGQHLFNNLETLFCEVMTIPGKHGFSDHYHSLVLNLVNDLDILSLTSKTPLSKLIILSPFPSSINPQVTMGRGESGAYKGIYALYYCPTFGKLKDGVIGLKSGFTTPQSYH
jgi:hypothetical protein